MKIDGVENKDLNEIILEHKGMNMKFECYIKPVPYMPRKDLQPCSAMTITFDDIHEINSMIDMLTRMKNMCIDNMGIWRTFHEGRVAAVHEGEAE